MGARSPMPTADERALLNLLDQAPERGEPLFLRSGLDRMMFDAAADRLWRRGLLQGVPGEGCCQDPCGINCIAALEPDQTWILTRLGIKALMEATQ